MVISENHFSIRIGTLRYERISLQWVYLGRAGKAKLRLNKKEACQGQEGERLIYDLCHMTSPDSCILDNQVQMCTMALKLNPFIFE